MFFNLPYLAAFVPYNIVPISELYSWSNNQKIHILFHKIAEICQATNDYDKIFTELQKLLTDFDDEVKEKITELLNEMYEDGTLSDLIAQVLSTEIPTRTGDLDLSCMGWKLNKAHSYGIDGNLPTVEQADNFTCDEEFYNYPQGNCAFEINGNKYWAVACVCQNGSHFDYNNGARIYIYTINQDGSLSYVTDKEYPNLGHCNGMCYFNGALYITPNSYQVWNATTERYESRRSTDIHRIEFDGSSLSVNVYTVSLEPIDYQENINFYDNVCGYENKLYVFNEHFSCCEVKFVADNPLGFPTGDVELTEWTEINGVGKGRSGTSDGLSITSDYIYFGSIMNRIKRYNKHTKTIDWTYQLPTVANNLQYKLGEVEGFTIIDNVLYLLGGYNMSGIGTKANCYTMMRFYRQNIVTNEINPTNTLGWSNGSVTRNVSLWVKGDVPNDTQSPKNVNGRSQDSPFACIQEVIDFIENNFWISRANIIVYQYRNLSPIEVYTNKPITITGTQYQNDNSTYTGSGSERHISNYARVNIGHIYIRQGSNVQINDVNIENILPTDIGSNDLLDNCIYSYRSNLYIENLRFGSGLIENRSTVVYALNLNRNNCNVRIENTIALDSEITGSKPSNWYQWEHYRGENIPNPSKPISFINTYDCTVNTHGSIHYKNHDGDYYNLYIDDGIIKCHNSNFVG